MTSRHDRSIRFFGEDGQRKLRNTKVTIVGVGGVGGHIVQQLALLGVGSLALVDAEMLAETNRNRYVTARASDVVPGTPKVDIAERLVRDIDPSIQVDKIYDSLVSERAFGSVIRSTMFSVASIPKASASF
jgi:tRNA A37 threonylcarbamoyladenosine dehydratase